MTVSCSVSAGFVITAVSRQLDSRHPANWKLLTMFAAANNITIGGRKIHVGFKPPCC